MAARNPFSPTFGASPPVIAGRDELLEAVDDALAAGPAHPDYTSLFLGARGAGKTVMLNAVEDLAQARGWLIVREDASTAGLPGRLARASTRLLNDLEEAPGRRLRSVTAAGLGVEFEPLDEPEPAESGPAEALRGVLTALGRVLADRGTGLLVTLDELLSADVDEVRQFGSVMQLVCRRERLPIAFMGAALPQFEEVLESDDAATFMQRCTRYDIGMLDSGAARTAIARPLEDAGATIGPAALDRAVEASSGYAFMIQLVGFHSWEAAPDPPSGITVEDVSVGIARAQRRIARLVLDPTWRGLSEVDRRFLVAMARDDGPSRLAEVAERLGVDTNYASVYRQRLIRAGMIMATGRGRIDLAHHAAREWLRAKTPTDDAAGAG